MPNRVYYHHPDDKQFSLDYVDPDPSEVDARTEGYDDETYVLVEEYDLDRTVYVVYTATGASGHAEALEYDAFEELQELDPPNAIIAARYVRIFKNVLEKNYEEEGERVRAYKDVDAELLDGALNQTDWSGTAVEVAGRLVSNLILKHSLPNANHRTAIGMLELYLSRLEPTFAMPETARALEDGEYDWREWVNEYIEESKRLLTVRRKGGRFQHLAGWGCEVLERKHGVEIWLDEYELDLAPSERWTRYAEAHERLWIEFVDDAVERASATDLRSTKGLSKHEFGEIVQRMD